MDQYCVLILMSLFSPAIQSLRDLQRASTLDKVRKRLGVTRASLGSLSESVAIFDPAPLKEIAAELGHAISSKVTGRFANVGQPITAVDGTAIETVKRVAELAWPPLAGGKRLSAYRLHAHFEVLSGKAVRIDATSASPKGDADERAVLERTVESDRCYVIDRGYAKFGLWNAINAKVSSYVCRLRDTIASTVVQVNELTVVDRAAGVISDEIVELGWKSRSRTRPDHPTRLIQVAVKPHESYRGMKRPRCVADRGQPSQSGSGTDCRDVSSELADRDVLPNIQATPRLPTSLVRQSQWCGDPSVLRHDRLHADPDLHR